MKTFIPAEKALEYVEVLKANFEELRLDVNDTRDKVVALAEEEIKKVSWISKILRAGTTKPSKAQMVAMLTSYDVSWGWADVGAAAEKHGIIISAEEYDNKVKDVEALKILIPALEACAKIGDPVELTAKEAMILGNYLE